MGKNEQENFKTFRFNTTYQKLKFWIRKTQLLKKDYENDTVFKRNP